MFLVPALPAPPADRSSPKNTDRALQKSVNRWLKSLSLHDKAAQLVMIPFTGYSLSSHTREYRKFVHLIRDVHVGGLILVNVAQGRLVQRAEPHEMAAFLNRMQRMSRLPLLVSGDFERGASMRVNGTTVFPHAMAFAAAGDPALTRYEGEVTARESRAMGVQWVFYPDADVNNNPDNPIINIRSFGENPQVVARNVEAFIEGAEADRRARVLTTAKHFPGHGDTATDTHLGLATVTADRQHLNDIELAPFRAAIAKGVDSIMTAHIAVPGIDSSGLPATLSTAILSGLLREDLGFHGLIVTDAMDMGAIVKGFGPADASVKALEAGADVVLMPPDPELAVNAIIAAVRHGRISQKRLDQSVSRVLAAKIKVGLDRSRLVDLEGISDVVNSPEANERAQEVADRAVTLLRNEPVQVPLRAPDKTCFLVLAEGHYSNEGLVFEKEIHKRSPNALVVTLDPSFPDAALDVAAQRVAFCDTTVVAAFANVAGGRGSVGLAAGFTKLLETLIASGKPVTLVALGDPYLLRGFPKVPAYLTTYSTVPPSETAAVKALYGEIPIRGRLPVTIPELAKYGDGMQLPATAAAPVETKTK
ncbi:MAG TPA: glycoside hydrolase family 3 N-terminal domain-containing protein [Bryobacteraceae bacterium]|nr:glycoside hydrolase family 3 N-terminal domain-containing protein [Bryobacteraceae bacterium]